MSEPEMNPAAVNPEGLAPLEPVHAAVLAPESTPESTPESAPPSEQAEAHAQATPDAATDAPAAADAAATADEAQSLADESVGGTAENAAVREAEVTAEVGAEASADETAEETAEDKAEAAKGPANLSPAACAALLAERFPALFGAGRALPIKLRIQADIQQRAPGIFSKKSLSIFLHRYTTSTAYLKALGTAPHRLDLDGAPAGDIDDVHRQAAIAEAQRRKQMFDERRAAERDLQREAAQAARQTQNAQNAAREAARHAASNNAEAEARRNRAALLRAFETTTLTPANFCALKGLVEAELQGQLTLARQEREQRAQEPQPGFNHRPDNRGEQRPGGRNDNRGDNRGGPRNDSRRDGGRPPQRPDQPRGPRPQGAGPRPGQGQGPRPERGGPAGGGGGRPGGENRGPRPDRGPRPAAQGSAPSAPAAGEPPVKSED
jgi:sRNA-binding protein